jgi:hypothetical protein
LKIRRRFLSRSNHDNESIIMRCDKYEVIVYLTRIVIIWIDQNVEVFNTVTMWIQIYTYKSANWSMILQSSLLFFYITSILKWFEFHQVILWSHFLSSWSYNLINLAFIDRFSQLSWKSRYSRNSRINYSRIVNDSLNLIRRTRQVALWHSLYFVSSEYNLVKLVNSRSYSDDLINWFTDENNDDEANDLEINDRDEIDEEYSWGRDRDGTGDEDETNDEYSIDRL